MAAPERLWNCAARTRPLEEILDDELVLFDPSTDETHFLSELPALILAELDATPRSLAELVDRLVGPGELDPAAEQKIRLALTHLEAAELVESQPRQPN